MSVHTLTGEIRATFAAGIFYPALAAALTLPDVCGGVQYPELNNGPRYVRWYDTFVLKLQKNRGSGIRFDGAVVYQFRNSMLHECSSVMRKSFGYDRLVFNARDNPNQSVADMNLVEFVNGEAILQRDLQRFIDEMTSGALAWQQDLEKRGSEDELLRLAKIVRLHPNGWSPSALGFKVLA